MIIDKIKELAAAKASVEKLEAALARDLPLELASLPSRFGFPDLRSFLAAVQTAAGGKTRGRSSAKSAQPAKRRRAKITAAVKAKVKALAKAGKTGAEIAKAAGISLPSVQNIKKALGLVRTKAAAKRKSKPTPKAKVKARRTRMNKAKKPAPAQAPVVTAAPAAAPAQ